MKPERFSRVENHTEANEKRSLDTLKKLFDTADGKAVFSTPVRIGDMDVITASDVQVGLGFGFGLGSGPHPRPEEADGDSSATDDSEPGMGGGGGGGGGASGRPVAVITVQDGEVRIRPVLDATRILLAFLTTLGSMAYMYFKMRKPGS